MAERRPVGPLRCGPPAPARYAIHLELYADRLVLPVPAGIGFSPPLRRDGAYVRGGACAYGLRTVEPTGLALIGGDALNAGAPSLGLLFAVWGQPLGSQRLASFTGAVRAFVDGRPWPAAPQRIPLHRHAEIVLEVGPWVPPHPRYLFPAGL